MEWRKPIILLSLALSDVLIVISGERDIVLRTVHF